MSSTGKIYGALSIALVLFCTGCSDDKFSQISNIEIKANDHRKVIRGQLIDGDKLLRVEMDKRREIKENKRIEKNG